MSTFRSTVFNKGEVAGPRKIAESLRLKTPKPRKNKQAKASRKRNRKP